MRFEVAGCFDGLPVLGETDKANCSGARTSKAGPRKAAAPGSHSIFDMHSCPTVNPTLGQYGLAQATYSCRLLDYDGLRVSHRQVTL